MVNFWSAPPNTDTLPDGEMLPCAPALAVMVNDGFEANVAAMDMFVVISLMRYELTAPFDSMVPPADPTITSAML